jgi:hypothetical protein
VNIYVVREIMCRLDLSFYTKLLSRYFIMI